MVCRNRDKGEAARNEIVRDTRIENVDLMIAEFSGLSQIRRLAAGVKRTGMVCQRSLRDSKPSRRKTCGAFRDKDGKTNQHWCPLKQDHPTGRSHLRPAIVATGKRGVLLVSGYTLAIRSQDITGFGVQKDWHISCKLTFPTKLAQCL